MNRNRLVTEIILICSLVFLASVISGCTVRTYKEVRPREDQSLAGNRGYIQGNIPAREEAITTKKTRSISVVEIELHSPIKFERGKPSSKVIEKTEDSKLWGNLGYVQGKPGKEEKRAAIRQSRQKDVVLYTVKKGDTLQKISKRFFGTTKKYQKIYKDNKGALKSMERIYPGQVLKIVK